MHIERLAQKLPRHAQHRAEAAQQGAAALRRAEVERKARGLLARLRAAWRGGSRMVAWWWLVVAFFTGTTIGKMIGGLNRAAKDD